MRFCLAYHIVLACFAADGNDATTPVGFYSGLVRPSRDAARSAGAVPCESVRRRGAEVVG